MLLLLSHSNYLSLHIQYCMDSFSQSRLKLLNKIFGFIGYQYRKPLCFFFKIWKHLGEKPSIDTKPSPSLLTRLFRGSGWSECNMGFLCLVHTWTLLLSQIIKGETGKFSGWLLHSGFLLFWTLELQQLDFNANFRLSQTYWVRDAKHSLEYLVF